MSTGAELPRYLCHKEVHALKIDALLEVGTDSEALWLHPVDRRYAPFKLDAEYVRKHSPHPGGYYVVYADGYKSFSPAEAFESGYALIGDGSISLLDLAETAWAIIANVSGSDWKAQSEEWQTAAIAWRERYHEALKGIQHG